MVAERLQVRWFIASPVTSGKDVIYVNRSLIGRCPTQLAPEAGSLQDFVADSPRDLSESQPTMREDVLPTFLKIAFNGLLAQPEQGDALPWTKLV